MTEHNETVEPAIKHYYAQIGGVRLHYAQSGGGDRLVLLLHGFPECWYSWRHQLRALGESFLVVAPDLRGYNLSDKPARVEDYKLDKLVDDVTGLIRYFGREKASIVGHDWGAGIAWAVAARHPEYVERLAALQVPPLSVWNKNLTVRQLLASWYMFFFQLPHLPEWLIRRNNFALLEKAFKTSTAKRGVIGDTEIAVYKQALAEPGALTGALNYYRANVFDRFLRRDKSSKNSGEANELRADDAPPKPGVRVPTLFIYGEQDQAVLPETVRGVGEFVDAPYRELRLPQSAHWVQQEAAEEVNAALLRFLNENF